MDYKPDQARVEFDEIERDMRRRLDATLDMTARFDEKAVDPLGLGERGGRAAPAQRGRARANCAAQRRRPVLNERARDECPGESWQGLSDAGTFVFNRLAQLGLPQLMHDDLDDEQD